MGDVLMSELANTNHHFAEFLKAITDFEVDNPNHFKGKCDEILSQYKFDGRLNQLIYKTFKN